MYSYTVLQNALVVYSLSNHEDAGIYACYSDYAWFVAVAFIAGVVSFAFRVILI